MERHGLDPGEAGTGGIDDDLGLIGPEARTPRSRLATALAIVGRLALAAAVILSVIVVDESEDIAAASSILGLGAWLVLEAAARIVTWSQVGAHGKKWYRWGQDSRGAGDRPADR